MTTIWQEQGMHCPVCGTISNPYPDYAEGKGTGVSQRLGYCGHLAQFEGQIAEPIVLWSYPSGLACIKWD